MLEHGAEQWVYLILVSAGFAIAFATFWIKHGNEIGKLNVLAQHADDAVRRVSISLDTTRQELSAFRERASERFATHVQLTTVESEVNKSLLAIGTRLDTIQRDLNARLDILVGLVRKDV
jgi:hypothetical protein